MKRPIRKILISRLFEKSFKRLPKHIQSIAEKKELLFRGDAFHPLLRTHNLGGALKDDWAYSVNQQYRVHFYFMDDQSVMYVDIGTHEIYK